MTTPDRGDGGKFVESPDSLYPKTIGLRVSKRDYPKLEKLSANTGKTMAAIAREAVSKYLTEAEEAGEL
ncbi:MAG: hypothetical protein AAF215_22700 [Cyanobacteria bacterium P01_A01_bin.123]